MPHTYSISDFSPHLFWDTDRSAMTFDNAKVQIIQQVLEYGRMEDWRIVEAVYDRDTIREVTTSLRSMDPVSHSFMAMYLNIDPKEFRCYKSEPSAHDFWNY